MRRVSQMSRQSAAQLKTRAVQESTKWKEYQAKVRAQSDLAQGAKNMFNALALHADYETGANCAPNPTELVKETGLSHQAIARYIRQLKAHGLVEAIPLRTPSGRWNRNGYRFEGHGFIGPT